jgi:hypothetical protein
MIVDLPILGLQPTLNSSHLRHGFEREAHKPFSHSFLGNAMPKPVGNAMPKPEGHRNLVGFR